MPALAYLSVRQAIDRHLDQAGKTIDSAQRGAQVVRHRITEGLQLLVGQLELGCALLHAVFQAGVEVADFNVRLQALEFGRGARGKNLQGRMQQGRLALFERLAKHHHQHPGHLALGIFQPVGRIGLGSAVAQHRRLRVQSLHTFGQDQAGGLHQFAARCLIYCILKLRHHLSTEHSSHGAPAQRIARQHAC